MINRLVTLTAVALLASCASKNAETCTACDSGAATPKTGSLTAMAKKASGADAMEKTAKAAASGDIKGAAAGAAAATPQGQAAMAAKEAAAKANGAATP
jgi:hypothetical protein